jgi:hypothetical protein
MVRMRGLPARYVSGYLVPQPKNDGTSNLEEVVGGQASHAWTEVFLPGAGWIGFDPTLGTLVGSRHVRVAYERDYGDVLPVRGVYKGHAGQRLPVDVRVRPVVDDNGHERLQETAARPVEETIAERPQQPASSSSFSAGAAGGRGGSGGNLHLSSFCWLLDRAWSSVAGGQATALKKLRRALAVCR